MPRDRPALAHVGFLARLSKQSSGNTKLERIVKDKVRLACTCRDLRHYTTKLKREKATQLYGRLLHFDIGKKTARLFAVCWDAIDTAGKTYEVILPVDVVPVDEAGYSNLDKYVHLAEEILIDFHAGSHDRFRLWLPDRKSVAESELPRWPFVVSRGD